MWFTLGCFLTESNKNQSSFEFQNWMRWPLVCNRSIMIIHVLCSCLCYIHRINHVIYLLLLLPQLTMLHMHMLHGQSCLKSLVKKPEREAQGRWFCCRCIRGVGQVKQGCLMNGCTLPSNFYYLCALVNCYLSSLFENVRLKLDTEYLLFVRVVSANV